MFTDHAAILQAAATLAAAQHIVADVDGVDPVQRLLDVLTSMAEKHLIPSELLPGSEISESVITVLR